jgi:hypothetical protein
MQVSSAVGLRAFQSPYIKISTEAYIFPTKFHHLFHYIQFMAQRDYEVGHDLLISSSFQFTVHYH